MKKDKKGLMTIALVLMSIPTVTLFLDIVHNLFYYGFYYYNVGEIFFTGIIDNYFISVWSLINLIFIIGVALFSLCFIVCAVIEFVSKRVSKKVKIVEKIVSVGALIFSIFGVITGIIVINVNKMPIYEYGYVVKEGPLNFLYQIISLIASVLAVVSCYKNRRQFNKI